MDVRPGLDPRRLAALIEGAIQRCALELSGSVVLTEAATGAYLVTPVLAAAAGADQVFAVTRATRHGSVDEVVRQTRAVADLLRVSDRIQIQTAVSSEAVALADIITNSGHVRPIDARMVSRMKPGAVVPLMYESWEYRPGDVDLVACQARGIQVGGTNERHLCVDVFSYLGIMAVKHLLDAGVAVYGSSVLLLCDNPFASFIERGLAAAGARVKLVSTIEDEREETHYDAVLCALTPRADDVLGAYDLQNIGRRWPGSVLVQYWGDIDRAAARAAGIPCWPPDAPGRGHMGILPSDVGPEPIVRLQAGGLKAAEVMWRRRGATVDSEYVQPVSLEQAEVPASHA
jgi:hypothetical protein